MARSYQKKKIKGPSFSDRRSLLLGVFVFVTTITCKFCLNYNETTC